MGDGVRWQHLVEQQGRAKPAPCFELHRLVYRPNMVEDFSLNLAGIVLDLRRRNFVAVGWVEDLSEVRRVAGSQTEVIQGVLDEIVEASTDFETFQRFVTHEVAKWSVSIALERPEMLEGQNLSAALEDAAHRLGSAPV